MIGFALGGVFGIVMSSFEFAGPQLTPQLQELSTREQMKIMLKDMGNRSYSSAKNFAVVAAIFSSSECFIEGVRSLVFGFHSFAFVFVYVQLVRSRQL